jgi:hypothetical protein
VSEAKRLAREFKKVASVMVCGIEGGKKAETSEVFAGRPGLC